MALVVKNPPANVGDVRDAGSTPGSGRSPQRGHGNPLHSIPAWRIPWTEAPGRLRVDNLESQITFILKYYFPSVLIFARFFLPLVTKSKVLHPFHLLK